MKITIKDIARLCNVSVTTVSRVINHKVDNIGADTVRKVEDKIRELGFKPNAIARSMVTGKSNTIGLVIPDVRNPFFSELAKGVEDFMNDQNYGVLLCNTDSSLEKEEQYIKLLRGKSVDGVIFTTQNTNESEKYFVDILKNHYPVVLIERYVQGVENVPGVYVDNFGGAQKMCRFLLERGYRKIACITGPLHTHNAVLRFEGYKSVMQDAGIELNHDIILEGNYHYECGYELMQRLLSEFSGEFDAVFACNDIMGYGAYKALQDAGLSVPGDIALSGFDNTPFLEVFEPKLTTINLPAHEMGKKAAEMLFKVMSKDESQKLEYRFELELVDKGSVGYKE